ncbi:MAG TPA: hypothetical protein PLH27_12965 [bacterium]|nr:hypothetical protein [bacterium]HMW32079.1 hypothetical protein [bacterium]HMW34920.1 hypothetical protein [bacterium]HMY35551.1 hypothetical protein [bacterium]HMZ04813.1 hypothetical protein [bacterium]
MNRFIFITIGVIGIGRLHAQNMEEKELFYGQTIFAWRASAHAADSLNQRMKENADEIVQQKKSIQPDKERIARSLAKGLTLSEQIKANQRRMEDYHKRIETLRIQLNSEYDYIIDSLRIQQKRQNTSSIEKQLRYWTEKKLLITPPMNNLSYDPVTLLKIDLYKITDPFEKEVRKEYLQAAIIEVDKYVDQIRTQRKVYESLVSLRKRTTDFIQDAYDAGTWAGFSRNGTSVIKNDGVNNGIDINPQNVQAKTVISVMRQIGNPSNIVRNYEKVLSMSEFMSESDYIQLLKEADKQLVAYRDLLTDKLNP